jgi:hypothetical protein
MFVSRRKTSIFTPRIVRELAIEKMIRTPNRGDYDISQTPAIPIPLQEDKKRKVKYLPGERLLKKLNKEAEKTKLTHKKIRALGGGVTPRQDLEEKDVERLSASVLSVLESLKI